MPLFSRRYGGRHAPPAGVEIASGRISHVSLLRGAHRRVPDCRAGVAQSRRSPPAFTPRRSHQRHELHVRVGGSGPAVVLLHGFGDTGDMWAPLAAKLVKDHTVIVPDLRGMGLSAHPDTGYTKKNEAARHRRHAGRAEDRQGRSRHPRYRQHGRLRARRAISRRASRLGW